MQHANCFFLIIVWTFYINIDNNQIEPKQDTQSIIKYNTIQGKVLQTITQDNNIQGKLPLDKLSKG